MDLCGGLCDTYFECVYQKSKLSDFDEDIICDFSDAECEYEACSCWHDCEFCQRDR